MAIFAHKLKVTCSLRNVCQLGVVHHPWTKTWFNKAILLSRRCFSSSSPVVVSASRLHNSTPWLMLQPPEIDPATGGKIDCFYSPTDKQVYKINRKKNIGVPEEARCFTSSLGWLGFIDPIDCSIYFFNPFRLDGLVGSIYQLPSIETLPSVLSVKRKLSPSCVNNSVDQFMIVVDNSNDSNKDHRQYIDPESLSRIIVKQLSLSHEPDRLLESAIAVAVVQGGCEIPQLAFCRVGMDDSWTSLIGSTNSFTQPVFSRSGDWNVFYSMYSDMFGHGIDRWDICAHMRIPTRKTSFMYQEHSRHLHEKFKFETSERDLRNRCKSNRYLVVNKLSGGIMLVIRHTAPHLHNLLKTLRFDVYKVDIWNRKLHRLKFIGDCVIFLGLNQSFVLSARKFPGLRPNSIYFTDDCNALPYGGRDSGIYNLEDNSIQHCYPLDDDDDLKQTNTEVRAPLLWVGPPPNYSSYNHD